MKKYLALFAVLMFSFGIVSAQEYSSSQNEHFGYDGSGIEEQAFVYFQGNEEVDRYSYFDLWDGSGFVQVSEPQTLVKDSEEKIVETKMEIIDYDGITDCSGGGGQCQQSVTWTVDDFGNIEILDNEVYEEGNVDMFSKRSLYNIHYLPSISENAEMLGWDIGSFDVLTTKGSDRVDTYNFSIKNEDSSNLPIFDTDRELISVVSGNQYEVRGFDDSLKYSGTYDGNKTLNYYYQNDQSKLQVYGDGTYDFFEKEIGGSSYNLSDEGTIDFGENVLVQNNQFISSNGKVYDQQLNLLHNFTSVNSYRPMSYKKDFVVFQEDWAGSGQFGIYDPEGNVGGVDNFKKYNGFSFGNADFAVNFFKDSALPSKETYSTSSSLESIVEFSSGTEVVNETLTISEDRDLAVANIKTEASQVTLDVTIEGNSKLESDNLLQNGNPMELTSSGEYTLESPNPTAKLDFTKNSDVSVNSVSLQGEEQNYEIPSYIVGQRIQGDLSKSFDIKPDNNYQNGDVRYFHTKKIVSRNEQVIEETGWNKVNFNEALDRNTTKTTDVNLNIDRLADQDGNYTVKKVLVKSNTTYNFDGDDNDGQFEGNGYWRDFNHTTVGETSYEYKVISAGSTPSITEALQLFWDNTIGDILNSISEIFANNPTAVPQPNNPPKPTA